MKWWFRKKPCKSWVKWRTKVYERDNYKCVLCGKGNRRLDPHHILPKSKFPKLRYRVSNGSSLCRKCHRKTFKKEHEFIELIVCKLFGSLKDWPLYKYYKKRSPCL